MSIASDFPTIHLGDSGSRIQLIQLMLDSLGYDIDSANGVYNYETWKAVSAFRVFLKVDATNPEIDVNTQLLLIETWWRRFFGRKKDE